MRSNYVSTDQAFCPQSQRFELGRDQVQGESIELVTFDIKLPLRQTARVLVRPCSGSTKFWFDRVLVRPCSGSTMFWLACIDRQSIASKTTSQGKSAQ